MNTLRQLTGTSLIKFVHKENEYQMKRAQQDLNILEDNIHAQQSKLNFFRKLEILALNIIVEL